MPRSQVRSIPTKDYYSLLGVFTSSKKDEYPLAAPAEVETYKKQKLEIDEKQAALTDWLNKQISDLVDILAAQTTRYIVSAWTVMTGERGDVFEAANLDSLDSLTLGRWIKYLGMLEKDYAFVKPWFDLVASRGGVEKLERSEVKKIGDEIQVFASLDPRREKSHRRPELRQAWRRKRSQGRGHPAICQSRVP